MGTELTVIGGGFWGTATAREAARQGKEVLLIDDGRPQGASRAAAGLSCRSWFGQRDGTIQKMMPLWWTGKSVAEGFNWLTGKMKAHEVGEWFSSYQDAKPKFRPDMLMLEDLSTALRTGPDITRQSLQVETLERSGAGWRVMTTDGPVFSKEVIVAAGAFTDQLLGLSGLPLVGVKALRGRALVLQLNQPLKTELPYTYMTRPYTHYTLRPWRNGLLRLGDTVERSSKGGDAAIQELLRVAALLAPGATVVEMLDGLRPVCDKAICRPISDGLIAMTGGHRVGLSMSQPFASAALRMLKEGVDR